MSKDNGDAKPHRFWWFLLAGGGILGWFALMPDYSKPWIPDEDSDIALVQVIDGGERSQWYELEVWNQGKSSKGDNQYVFTVYWGNGGYTEVDVRCYKDDDGGRVCVGVDEDARMIDVKEFKH